MSDTTKRPSRHRSSKFVLFLDKLAHYVITIGGIGTIFAVLTVCFFLIYVVWPMFAPVSSKQETSISLGDLKQPQYVQVDDDRLLIWTINKLGVLNVVDSKSGELISRKQIFNEKKPSALTMSPIHNLIAAGFEDGSIQMAHVSFTYSFLDQQDIETTFHDMEEGDVRRRGEGVVVKTPSRQWRQTLLQVEVESPLKISRSKVIKNIDFTMSTGGPVIATYDEDHLIEVHKVTEKTNLMTMTTEKKLVSTKLPYAYTEKIGDPKDIILIGQGGNVLAIWEDGYSERYNLLDNEPFLAEKSKLAQQSEITAVGRFLGRNTVLLGYADGKTSAWFLTEPKNAETKDARVWAEGHVFEGDGNAVASISSSKRQRLALIAYANNRAKMVHVTSERVIYNGEGITNPQCVAIAPKDDGLALCSDEEIALVKINAEHPDVTFASLFFPVWYESYEGPETVWQSSSASDDAEPKLGLWPLIFGTLKATFYSLLFGVPVALGAAIYSSEFMPPKVKKSIKPGIEMMASLPSVVLGFLGGIIVSVWMKNYVIDVLAAFFIIPLTVVGAAYITQLLPRDAMVIAIKYRLLIIGIPCFVIGWLLSLAVGSLAEQLVFGGDFITWLEGEGSSFGGVWYLCLPVSIVAVIYAMSRWGKPALIERLRGASLASCAVIDAIKFLVCIVAVIVLAAILAGICMLLSFEFRGPGAIFDIYETRNAMVVGFMMAFAIIPIIYTIADDALSTVPSHLRAASLGSGATPWQTAIRIVVPTAMSGLFSAIMVGLGRAIGETMIVLMAAGNTPIKDFNIFNGLKTLSANIASELPESVVGSTHYRTLFLSALVLFVMTFILNTIAESIRNRFRKTGGVSVSDTKKKQLGGAAIFYYGEPMVWLTGSALVACVIMISGFLLYILWKGLTTFWPLAINEYELKTGHHIAGEVHISESYKIPKGHFDGLDESIKTQIADIIESGSSDRLMLRSCNFELTGSHFTWIDENLVQAESEPEWLCFVERLTKKPFIGYPQAFYADGQKLAEGDQASWDALHAVLPDIQDRYWQRWALEKHDLGDLRRQETNARMYAIEVKLDLQDGDATQAELDEAEAEYERIQKEVEEASLSVLAKIKDLKEANSKYFLEMRTADGKVTRIPGEEVIRIYAPNQIGFFGKLGVYISRWWEFLSNDPRQANSQGGIWPALFGTVVMTILMTIFVVPFGVIAALYMREYAKKGPLLSTVRIAINNLAGVPSIVFGVFGLGFFCYIIGDWVDNTFYPAYAHEALPVFKKGGILWAACTLALLTLPVVIVATEEALSAVPNSMREGSYGCGASKWQTIRRIVLPRAMPGIMTGMILAMARGAGEVAPLMLVGAVKMAAELPTDPSASFMHLGFHIYDLSYHSQDSEAAKPMVFTTTLLLITMVAILNIVAINLRNKLNKRFNVQTF